MRITGCFTPCDASNVCAKELLAGSDGESGYQFLQPCSQSRQFMSAFLHVPAVGSQGYNWFGDNAHKQKNNTGAQQERPRPRITLLRMRVMSVLRTAV